MERMRDILTPEQAADYLQVDRETVYRYIRQGKLDASRLGRNYRIPRRSLEFLLWTTRSRPDIPLCDYSSEEIADFLAGDALDPAAHAIVQRFHQPNEARGRA